MIPRRRIELEAGDLADCLRAPFLSKRAAADEVACFESEFARAMGVPHAIAVASGREALELIVDGLGLGRGDEIVIPAYTLGELLPLLSRRGLVLVPADIDPETFNVTTESVRAAVGPRTRAILAVHLLGAPCPVDAICALGIPVIEDCAHAPGARVGDRVVGSFGVAALFSLEATKAIAAFGGGVLATTDARLADTVREILSRRERREWPVVRKIFLRWCEELLVRSPAYGLLARILFDERNAERFERFYRRAGNTVRPRHAFSATQARIARRKLARLERREGELAPLWQGLATSLPPGFKAQRRDTCGTPVFYNFVAFYDGDIRALRQRALVAGLDLGIGSEVMDDTARLLQAAGCPGAARAAAHAVLLPLYPGIGARTLAKLVQRLHAIAPEGGRT